jgi:hypothetical protein
MGNNTASIIKKARFRKNKIWGKYGLVPKLDPEPERELFQSRNQHRNRNRYDYTTMLVSP